MACADFGILAPFTVYFPKAIHRLFRFDARQGRFWRIFDNQYWTTLRDIISLKTQG
jgi:hypothetical protein